MSKFKVGQFFAKLPPFAGIGVFWVLLHAPCIFKDPSEHRLVGCDSHMTPLMITTSNHLEGSVSGRPNSFLGQNVCVKTRAPQSLCWSFSVVLHTCQAHKTNGSLKLRARFCSKLSPPRNGNLPLIGLTGDGQRGKSPTWPKQKADQPLNYGLYRGPQKDGGFPLGSPLKTTKKGHPPAPCVSWGAFSATQGLPPVFSFSAEARRGLLLAAPGGGVPLPRRGVPRGGPRPATAQGHGAEVRGAESEAPSCQHKLGPPARCPSLPLFWGRVPLLK